jgi:hypothetical protein
MAVQRILGSGRLGCLSQNLERTMRRERYRSRGGVFERERSENIARGGGGRSRMKAEMTLGEIDRIEK